MQIDQRETTATLIRPGVAGERPAGYTRMIQTDPDGPNGGALFLTWDAGWPEGFPVFRAPGTGARAGLDWERVGEATGGVGAGGFRMQPSFYELPREFAGLAAGTLLLAGQAVTEDEQSSNIVIFASNDAGCTWRPVSHVDTGGPIIYDPSPESTTVTIWEPELELRGAELVCYYSDERYKAGGMLQTIVHRTSRDLVTWSDRVLDLGVGDRQTRPGMFVTARGLADTFAVVEIVGRPGVPVNLRRPVGDTDWGDPADLGERLVADDGTWLSGTPNLTATRLHGAGNGDDSATVIVTGRFAYDSTDRLVDRALINTASGRGTWKSIELPFSPGDDRDDGILTGYSQTLLLTNDGQRLVQATTVRNDVGTTDVVVAVAPYEGTDK
jgi:hypothetical protein